MGTNYYHRTNICDCCGRYDETHICKSLVSWHGVFGVDDERGGDVPVLTSWAGWKARLLSEGEIWDEYGTQWTIESFIAHVEATDPAARRRQFDWCLANSSRCTFGMVRGGEWLDAWGFSFYGAEFS